MKGADGLKVARAPGVVSRNGFGGNKQFACPATCQNLRWRGTSPGAEAGTSVVPVGYDWVWNERELLGGDVVLKKHRDGEAVLAVMLNRGGGNQRAP